MGRHERVHFRTLRGASVPHVVEATFTWQTRHMHLFRGWRRLEVTRAIRHERISDDLAPERWRGRFSSNEG